MSFVSFPKPSKIKKWKEPTTLFLTVRWGKTVFKYIILAMIALNSFQNKMFKTDTNIRL